MKGTIILADLSDKTEECFIHSATLKFALVKGEAPDQFNWSTCQHFNNQTLIGTSTGNPFW